METAGERISAQVLISEGRSSAKTAAGTKATKWTRRLMRREMMREAIYSIDSSKRLVLSWPDKIPPEDLEDIAIWLDMMKRVLMRSAKRDAERKENDL